MKLLRLTRYSQWIATGKAVAGSPTTIVIAEIGSTCSLSKQMSYSSAVGVKYLLAYNLESSDPSPFGRDVEIQIPFPSVTTIVTTSIAGERLVNNLQGDASYKLSFTSRDASSIQLVTGGLMSNFSSFGPSWDTLTVKPTLSAPGGKILAT
jgi:hypothetical protein